jgi:AhpD family alkylhydroperoxidase
MALQYVEQYHYQKALEDQFLHETEPIFAGFVEFREKVMATGAISAHVKQLVALGIAIALGCQECAIRCVHDALAAGGRRNEIIEVVQVAILLGGAPALACGSQVIDMLNQM